MMLVLTRRPGESIELGNGVTITFIAAHGRRIRVGVTAPQSLKIVRHELKRHDRRPRGASNEFPHE